jgi:hypothetical protein
MSENQIISVFFNFHEKNQYLKIVYQSFLFAKRSSNISFLGIAEDTIT